MPLVHENDSNPVQNIDLKMQNSCWIPKELPFKTSKTEKWIAKKYSEDKFQELDYTLFKQGNDTSLTICFNKNSEKQKIKIENFWRKPTKKQVFLSK